MTVTRQHVAPARSAEATTKPSAPAPAKASAAATGVKAALRGATYAEGAAALAPEPAAAAAQAKERTFPDNFHPDGTGRFGYEVKLADPRSEVTGLVIDVRKHCLGGGRGHEVTFGEGQRNEEGQIHVVGVMGRVPIYQALGYQPDVGKNPLYVAAKGIIHGPREEEVCLDTSTRAMVDEADAWKNSRFIGAGRVSFDWE